MSVMTWISLVGITLAVFALIATLAVRAGFRAEFVDTILGANAHVTVYSAGHADEQGNLTKGFPDDAATVAALRAIEGVTRAAPLVRGQVMVTAFDQTTGGDVYGMTAQDLASLPRIGAGSLGQGNLADFSQGIAMGSEMARELGVTVGDRVRLIAPSGVKSALGTSPRVKAYTVEYIFTAGRYDIDKVRLYLPLAEAQSFFNRSVVGRTGRCQPGLVRQAAQHGDVIGGQVIRGSFVLTQPGQLLGPLLGGQALHRLTEQFD